MKIKDLISKKDYDYVSYRVTHPKFPEGVFAGSFESKDGIIIPHDQDYYSPDEEVLWYEEWSQDNIANGLTVLVEAEWIIG